MGNGRVGTGVGERKGVAHLGTRFAQNERERVERRVRERSGVAARADACLCREPYAAPYGMHVCAPNAAACNNVRHAHAHAHTCMHTQTMMQTHTLPHASAHHVRARSHDSAVKTWPRRRTAAGHRQRRETPLSLLVHTRVHTRVHTSHHCCFFFVGCLSRSSYRLRAFTDNYTKW